MLLGNIKILFLDQDNCSQNVYYFVTELVFSYFVNNRHLTAPQMVVLFRLIHSHLPNWNNQQFQTELILPEDRSLPDGLRDVLVWNHRQFF